MTIYHPHKSRVGLFTRISLLLILCLLPTALSGKTPRLYRKADPKTRTATSYQLRYRMAGAVGFLNRDDKVRDFRFDRPVITGGTVALEFLPTGRWKCMQQWNNASIGLAFSVFDLGQQRYLGQVFTPHAYLSVPLVRQSRVTFGLRPGLGVAFVNQFSCEAESFFCVQRHSSNLLSEWMQYSVSGCRRFLSTFFCMIS